MMQTQPQRQAAGSSKAASEKSNGKQTTKSKAKSSAKSGAEKEQAEQPVITVVPRSMFAPPPPSADDFADLFASGPVAEVPPEERLLSLIEDGKHQEAVRLLIELRKGAKHDLPQPHLAKLIRDLVEAKDLHNAIPLMAEHIRSFSENRLTLQINLAKILLQKQRPAKALQVLKSVDRLSADEKNAATVDALISHAEALVKAGAS